MLGQVEEMPLLLLLLLLLLVQVVAVPELAPREGRVVRRRLVAVVRGRDRRGVAPVVCERKKKHG